MGAASGLDPVAPFLTSRFARGPAAKAFLAPPVSPVCDVSSKPLPGKRFPRLCRVLSWRGREDHGTRREAAAGPLPGGAGGHGTRCGPVVDARSRSGPTALTGANSPLWGGHPGSELPSRIRGIGRRRQFPWRIPVFVRTCPERKYRLVRNLHGSVTSSTCCLSVCAVSVTGRSIPRANVKKRRRRPWRRSQHRKIADGLLLVVPSKSQWGAGVPGMR